MPTCCSLPPPAARWKRRGWTKPVSTALLGCPAARGGARGGCSIRGWPLPRVIDALLKLCHDALALAAGGGARYFPVAAVPRAGDRKRLPTGAVNSFAVARYDEHPWHEGLLLDALVSQGQRALTLRA